MPCTEPDVQGNGEENWGRTKEQHCWEQAPKKGQQAPPPPPEPVTRRPDPALGNVQLFVQGISPGDPLGPHARGRD